MAAIISAAPFKGALGDVLHAVMRGAGHNLKLISAKLGLLPPELATLFGLMAMFDGQWPILSSRALETRLFGSG
ncbi:hypothetical protein J2W37_006546 [Variovorax paradoxus]|uniref:hypothetical protein n=1 Tax=Variovorax paradoxus TaxID=34073 RepID=UPI001AE94456|nr:hypothetical protein [Variovorax paradoxus]MDP9968767.1 hypothetical protein [Variovorax paradoxus]